MVFEKILMGDFVGPEVNPSRENQYRIIATLDNCPYVVPMIIDEHGKWFLKAMYPSRKEKRRLENREQEP